MIIARHNYLDVIRPVADFLHREGDRFMIEESECLDASERSRRYEISLFDACAFVRRSGARRLVVTGGKRAAR